MSVTLYGKPVAEKIRADILARSTALRENRGIQPVVAILRAGERPDDIAYEKRVLKMCGELELASQVTALAEDVSHEDFRAELIRLNEDPGVHGILVFRPLPAQIIEEEICSLIAPEKDIDCMNPENLRKVFTGDETAIAPCTPEAVIELLKYYDYELSGKLVAIANRSLVLGKPLAMLFLKENATVTICHSKTEHLDEIIKNADIFVSGIGKAKYFDGSVLSQKNTVVDVGINFADGKMCGDVNFASASDVAAAVTPVPGGIGTITSTILLRHLIEAAERSF